MTPWRTFAVALSLPILFTTVVLVGVWRNRDGDREAITLSQREVSISAESDENSGVAAHLIWSVPSPRVRWLSLQQLAALGFDPSEPPMDRRSGRRYSRQLHRRAYVAFALMDRPPDDETEADQRRSIRSRLVPVDAALDQDELLRKYPDGRTHLVTAAVIGITRDGSAGNPTSLDGYVVNIDPRRIHVPAQFADRLRRSAPRELVFTISVRYGTRLEPWIVDVR